MNHVLQMYLKQNPDKDRACYSHFTTATGFNSFSNHLVGWPCLKPYAPFWANYSSVNC